MLISGGGGDCIFQKLQNIPCLDVEYNHYLSSPSGKFTNIPLLCMNMVSVKVLFLNLHDVIVDTFYTEKYIYMKRE